MRDEVIIDVVNRVDRSALTSDGEWFKLSNFMDDDGDACDPSEAVACVATNASESWWVAVDLRDFEIQIGH